MKKQQAIIFFLLTVLSSCDGYRDTPPSEDAIHYLNSQLETARANGEGWANSPLEITRTLFPTVSHDGGPARYEITQKYSKARCTVTVLEEGPIDDEVCGERRKMELELVSGKWKIVSYHYAVKPCDYGD